MFGFSVNILERPGGNDLVRIGSFLARFSLSLEGGPDVSVIVEDATGNLAGTGSLQGNVIRMMAVEPDWQEAGLSGTIVSRLVEWGRARGMTHFFVFTKPDSSEKFLGFGFRELARYEPFAALLEMGQPGINHFTEYLKSCQVPLKEGQTAGCVVVNCNPFTVGHQYLIAQASSRCSRLYAIVVEADLSSFPFSDRLELVRRGTSHLPNVSVVRSGEYAVSPATFPSYFLKDTSLEKIASIQARLDVTLFANLFVPALDISTRFVGTEPCCPVTGSYNEAMKEILPPRGVALEVIPRMTLESGDVVSASTVRAMLREDNWDVVRGMVPDCTWDYLHSEKGRAVIEKIKKSKGRH
ncbi:MAG: [citrate (pro-3S)-lyase] ligase [Thermovirgaceae bacterium]|nr:[citrate (pro-3S)-lyase] ligase [Thermovirgaceae bacterium]